MSKPVRDCTTLTARVNSKEGNARQNSRLKHTGVVRLLLAGFLFLFLAALSIAQPPWADPYPMGWMPMYPPYPDGQPPAGPPPFPQAAPYQYLYTGSDNWTGADRYTMGGVTLTGSVRGAYSYDAQAGNRGYQWWVGGSLTNEGTVRQLETLTVQGTVGNWNRILTINTLNFMGNATNYMGGVIGGTGQNDYVYELNVSGVLTNYGPGIGLGGVYRGRGEILHVEAINAGYLYNYGLIQPQQTNTSPSAVGYINVANDLINGNNYFLNPDNSARSRREAEIISTPLYFTATGQQVGGLEITVGGNLIQHFDGSIRAAASYEYVYDINGMTATLVTRAAPNIIDVGGELYNAGEIRITPPTSDADLNGGRWLITAGSLYNDGRSWAQWDNTRGGYERAGQNDAWGIIYDAQINTRRDLTNIGINAVINGMVTSDLGLSSYQSANIPGDVSRDMMNSMHVGGNLYNLDRASIFNYKEIIIHGNLTNRGATLVGGTWSRHSNLTDLHEHPMLYPTGHISVGGNVYNITEYSPNEGYFGGLIASFDRFTVHGSLYNDANSMITGTYHHHNNNLFSPYWIANTYNGTGPYGDTFANEWKDSCDIYGRRASILNGSMLEGEYADAPTVLNVMGLISDSLPGQSAFFGLYNEGHIREIDILSVGSNESGVLWNALGVATPGATLPTVSLNLGSAFTQSIQVESTQSSVGITAGTITDIGIINATNLVNEGTISDIDVAINVSYALVNTSTGTLDGLSLEHVEWTYNPEDGTPIWDVDAAAPFTGLVRPPVVAQTSRANLNVGESTAANEFVSAAGIGIINEGTIMNFENVISLGEMYNSGTINDVTSITVGSNLDDDARANFYNMGTLQNVDNVYVSGSLDLGTGSSFGNIGTVTAYNNVDVSSTINGGFKVLSAKNGFLTIETSGSLTIDAGSVASGNVVVNYGNILNRGLLNSATNILNEGFITNNGMMSSFGDVANYGTVSGSGMIFVADRNSQFKNETRGTIVGGLAINGNFLNYNGNIVLTSISDTIRVTNGIAEIRGGIVSATSGFNPTVGKQYVFLSTDISESGKAGNLIIIRPLVAEGSGVQGSVLDFTPVFGSWDGTKFVPGHEWSVNNQYYWLEVQRAYQYAPFARTKNQIALGKYVDKTSRTVKQNSAYWGLLQQLDGVSERNPKYADHQGLADYNGISPRSLRALNELSGVSYANIGSATANNMGVVNRTLSDVLRSDVFKFSFVGNPNNAIRGQAIAPLRYTRWGTLFGIGGKTAYDGNASGYRQSYGGVIAGFDRAMWTGTRVGAWVACATGDVTQRRVNENTDIVNGMIGMYLRQEMYFGYALLSGGFGVDNYKTKRHLDELGYHAKSDFNGYIGTAYIERGIDIPIYYATLQPFVSFQTVSVWQEDFSETMRDPTGRYAGIGIRGDETQKESYMASLGARASSIPIPFKWGQVAFTANAAWYHEFNPDRHEFTGRFINNGNFDPQGAKYTIYGTDPKRDWCNIGCGLHMDRNSTRIFLGTDMLLNDTQMLFSGSGGVVTSW